MTARRGLLTPAFEREADRIGIWRQSNGEAVGAVDKVGIPLTREGKLWTHIWGARCEFMGGVLVEAKAWNRWDQNFPDFHGALDVKGRTYHRYGLIVTMPKPEQLQQRREWLYLSVSREDHPEYVADKWAPGRDIMQEKYREEYHRRIAEGDGYLVPIRDPMLRDVEELVEILKKMRSDAA